MIFGSNELVVSRLQEGLVDELQIVVNPLGFGDGHTSVQGFTRRRLIYLEEMRGF